MIRRRGKRIAGQVLDKPGESLSCEAAGSDVEALVFEVEVAPNPEPDVVRDRAAPPKSGERIAFGVEQFAAEPLVVLGAALDRAVVSVVEARAEASRPEAVRASHAFGGVVAHPVLLDEHLEPRQRRFGGVNARLRILARLDAVVLEPERCG